MTRPGAIIAMEKCLEQVAGKSAAARVMEGSEKITEKTDGKRLAQWAKGAVERLDALLDEGTRVRVMEECGHNCARKNHRVIDRAVARRRKYANLDDFLAAEQRNPMKGTRLEREGNMLYQYYTPQAFTRPMRCYCGLFRGLPAGEAVSPTYCSCSKGFVERYWEAILKRPVRVELLQSAISGGRECKFAIQL
jgi:hypothetical protein